MTVDLGSNMEVWRSERVVVEGGIAVLREKVRLTQVSDEHLRDVHRRHLSGGIELMETTGFSWDNIEENSNVKWWCAVVLKSSGHRMSVMSTDKTKEVSPLREGDFIFIDATKMHRVERPTNSKSSPLFIAAIIKGYNKRPTRDMVERQFMKMSVGK